MRWVLYVDMDAFYVACERRDRPDLEGKPVLVGPDPKLGPTRGVVLAASYEARPSGVRSAMPVRVADQLCPGSVWVPADFPKYERTANEVRSRLSRFSPDVLPLSIDEAALTMDCPDAAAALSLGQTIQADLRETLHLPATVGIGPSRLVAKIVTDEAKPGGVRVVSPDDVVTFLAPLPIRAVPGVGPKTEERLQAVGVRSIGDCASVPRTVLTKALGSFGEELRRLARGEHVDPPDSGGTNRSRSAEETFEEDLDSLEQVEAGFDRLVSALSRGLASERYRYQTVTVAVRWADFSRVQRSRTLPAAAEGPAELTVTGLRLLREMWSAERAGRRRPARMLSVGAERLVPSTLRSPALESFDGSEHH